MNPYRTCFALAAVLWWPIAAHAAVGVVTTTPIYADIVAQIGGPHVTVESIMRGPENVHNVRPKPSHMIKLKRADLFIHSGLDGELWAPLLIKGARNPNLRRGAPGNVDVSARIALKEVPGAAGLTRALGDIHVYGNTHYALDPLNGVIIARTITDALKRTDPTHADAFEQNYTAYATRLQTLTQTLTRRIAPYRGTPVVTYHRTWPYFLDRFRLKKVAEVEPKPGISPGPRHLAACVDAMNAAGAKIVIVETFNSRQNAEAVARRANGVAVVLAQEVHALPDVDTYEQLFEYNVEQLLDAFRQVGAKPVTDGPTAPGDNPAAAGAPGQAAHRKTEGQ